MSPGGNTINRFPILAVIAIALLAGSSFAKWELYGLKGKKVTSLATGIYFGDTMLLAGTQSEGVFVRYKRADTFSLLTRAGTDTVVPAIKSIHSLFMQSNPAVPALLYAGTDSGLFSYRFTSGLIPQWYKINGIPSEPVVAIAGRNDTLFAATPTEIYKNGTGIAAWEPCSVRTFLPAMQRMSAFSSLSIFKGINAGSSMSGAMSSWWGILYSQSWGKSWEDVSILPAQSSPRLTSVLSLDTYAPDWTQSQRLAVGTSSGVFYATDFVTDIWHPCDPQLNIAPARHLYVSYHSKSNIADIFASTDSGVCILSALVKSGEWVLSRPGKANAVISLTPMDPKEWFAATADGVYRFTLNNSGAYASIIGKVASYGNCTYLNGKPLCTGLLAPVVGCTVSVTRATAVTPVMHYTAITDNAGNYSIDSIPIVETNDTFHVTASAGLEHSKGSQDVILADAQTKTVNFNLENSYTNLAIVTNDSLSFSVSTDKKLYAPGDSIFVRYSVKNTTTHAIQYWFTPGCDFDLLLKGISGDTLYRLSKNRACITMMIDGSISPDSSVSVHFSGILVTNNAMDSIVTVTANATTVSFGKTATSIDIAVKKPTVAVLYNHTEKKSFLPQVLFAHDKKLVLSLAKGEHVSIAMYTLSGQKIQQVMDWRYLPAGENSVIIAGWYCAESVYILQIKGESFSISRAIHSGR